MDLSFQSQQKPAADRGICRQFVQFGSCTYGSQCRFLHQVPQPLSTPGYRPRLNLEEFRSRSSSTAFCSGEASQAAVSGSSLGAVSKAPFQTGPFLAPDQRRWLTTPRCRHQGAEESLMVVSYNVLSSKLATEHHRELYPHLDVSALTWQVRLPVLVKELLSHQADILCLQEVDCFQELEAQLSMEGYKGVFQGRTGDNTDGCATFWKTDTLELADSASVAFSSLGLRDNVALIVLLKAVETDKQPQGRSKQPLHPSRQVVVGNTHVLFNPKRGDIKLAQVRELSQRAYQLAAAHNYPPVLLCGDFNSSPESPIYHFLTHGALNCEWVDRRDMSGRTQGVARGPCLPWQPPPGWAGLHQSPVPPQLEPPPPGTPQQVLPIAGAFTQGPVIRQVRGGYDNGYGRPPGGQRGGGFGGRVQPQWGWHLEELATAVGAPVGTVAWHPLRGLKSAYAEVRRPRNPREEAHPACREPGCTSYHSKFMGTVDYIWYTPGLIPSRVLDMLAPRVLNSCQGLPAEHWPSDHLSLVAEFRFSNPPGGGGQAAMQR